MQLSNGDKISSTQEGDLKLSSQLPSTKATVLPHLTTSSLISLGKLCDEGCNISLNKETMQVQRNGNMVLQGYRNQNDGLWDIPVYNHPNPKTSIQPDNYILPPSHNIYKYDTINLLKSDRPTKTYKHAPSFKTKRSKTHLNHSRAPEHFDDIIKEFNVGKTEDKVNIIIYKKQTKRKLVQYLHATCFSPVSSTWIKAIENGNFISWPGLTANLVRKHLPPSIATARGHIRQEYQGLQSTKPLTIAPNAVAATLTSKHETPAKTNEIINFIIDTSDSVAYWDLCGRFPYRSAEGNQYIMITYHVDANAILIQPLRNREAETITKAWNNIYDRLQKAGQSPTVFIMDNEASAHLKNTMDSIGIKYQLVTPHNHRANLAERAIQSFKSHFKAGLCSVDPNFPINQWDQLLQQAEITLNLLRNATTNPKLSAYSYLFGNYNFLKHPMAPPGIKVVAHSKPGIRQSWQPNGELGYYVGPATQHYRCFRVYFPKTKTIRVTDTVTFIPHLVPIPEVKRIISDKRQMTLSHY